MFATISKKIISIKETFNKRNLKEIVNIIDKIQSFEKEKLTLVAAQHLDLIHQKMPSVNPNVNILG
jgi:hypothetical protein